MTSSSMEYPILWRPDAAAPSHMTTFRLHINQKFSLELGDYEALWQWSVDHRAAFWGEIATFVDFKFTKDHSGQVVDESLKPADVPVWFEGAEMNYAANMLRYNDDRTALIQTGETEVDELISFRELNQRVAKFRAALVAMGVEKNDRVCAYIPNCAEAIICMLAAASLGAIWSSTSPDFGVTGVLDRFEQINPKVVIAANAVHYNGKVHSHLDKIAQVAAGLDTVVHVVVFPFVKDFSMDLSGINKGIAYNDFLALSPEAEPCMSYVPLPFNHPLFIMFSSGTTGKPKSIVHSAGGTLLQHMKEHVLHGEMNRDSKIMYYSTTGWMMWNWLVSALAVGACVVCYDGSPMLKNKPAIVWDLVDRHDLTVLGVSAKYIDALEQMGVKPRASHKLSKLRLILSTGSPLKPSSYDFVYRDVKEDVVLGSITGGTDIISLFAAQTFVTPVHRGLIHAPCLGMKVECWSDAGVPVTDETGELVCAEAFPSQPIYFWNDKDNARYQKSYFQGFPGGVWSHGDYVRIHKATHGIEMLGRSDGVLNPNGVRFGSSELYRVTERFSEVQDTLAVGQMVGSNDRVVLFVKMADGQPYTDALVKAMRVAIRAELSPRHVPAIFLPVADIPYTLSGKKVEVAIKRIINNIPLVKQTGALRNPEALDLYYNIPELSMDAEMGA